MKLLGGTSCAPVRLNAAVRRQSDDKTRRGGMRSADPTDIDMSTPAKGTPCAFATLLRRARCEGATHPQFSASIQASSAHQRRILSRPRDQRAQRCAMAGVTGRSPTKAAFLPGDPHQRKKYQGWRCSRNWNTIILLKDNIDGIRRPN